MVVAVIDDWRPTCSAPLRPRSPKQVLLRVMLLLDPVLVLVLLNVLRLRDSRVGCGATPIGCGEDDNDEDEEDEELMLLLLADDRWVALDFLRFVIWCWDTTLDIVTVLRMRGAHAGWHLTLSFFAYIDLSSLCIVVLLWMLSIWLGYSMELYVFTYRLYCSIERPIYKHIRIDPLYIIYVET